MKKILILTTLIAFFSCVKTHEKFAPLNELSTSATATTTEVNYIDNNIKTSVTKGNVETITLKNGVVITKTRDLINSTLFHVVKKFNGAIKQYNETVIVKGDITTVSLFYLTGERFFATEIKPSGEMNILFADMPAQNSCVGDAINICIHNAGCVLLCTAGGWGGCVLGWVIGCSFF